MMYDLHGKSVLVTGGANEIGFSCVKEMLRAGARAATVVDIDEENGELALEELIREFGQSKVLLVKADVTKKEQFEDAFQKSLKTWGSIDILINNAGVFNDRNWEQEIILNVNSLVQGTLLGLQYMGKDKGRKGGVIVNMSSILGLQQGVVSPIYSATKYFVNGFSRSLGTPYHYDRTSVRIVTFCPGFTITPLTSLLERCDANFLFPDLRHLFNKEYGNVPKQTAKKVGEDIVTSIQKGGNGSMWVSEDNKPVYEIDFPEWRTFRK